MMRSFLQVNQELLHLIEQISREKGIEKSVLVDAVQSAVLSAARKRFESTDNLNARLTEETGTIDLIFAKTVVSEDDLVNDQAQIGLEEAQEIDPGATIGGTVEVVHEMGTFGRIAAQAAKQVIIQKVREAEREMVYKEFKERQGDLVNGAVARVEREGNLIVDLGKTEGLLPRREQSFRETFKRGDRIRAYVIEVKHSSSGHQVILSRTHPGFLIRLFEMEVPEIYEGIVEIKEAVRDSSGRAKIAVVSHEKDIDPVGACVGMKGMRVQAVVQELRGEKIDIIQWTDDQEQFVRNALSPAKVSRVYMNDAEKTMLVIVPNDQLSLAIGKRGQNVRLAAKLTHWKIDITSASEADDDSERREALRRAEMAFQTPQRTVEATDITRADPSSTVEEHTPEADVSAATSQDTQGIAPAEQSLLEPAESNTTPPGPEDATITPKVSENASAESDDASATNHMLTMHEKPQAE
jgi:N utilization substance protein A